jgi:glutamyl-tRNA synthetase
MTERKIRVRIAPSPTGYFHVGTARTAIYNWLFARKHGGEFLLRIEDTDEERSKKEWVDIILDGLKWMGVPWDGEVVYQSQRMGIYAPHADRLVAEGKAFRCFCPPQESVVGKDASERSFKYSGKCRDLPNEEIEQKLAAGVPSAVRLKMPKTGEATFTDAVYGKVNKAYEDLDDIIILKSDRRPIYNFAVVVDDHDMSISHVIRGNDHIANTFFQVELYKALGWDVPEFSHLPLILRPDRSKVSKRKGDKGVTEYFAEGFLPEAFVNYLALVGWSPKDDREKMTREEMIAAFTLEGINPNNAIFDVEKLLWMNGEYIRQMDSNKLVELAAPYFIDAGITTKYWIETNWHYVVKVIAVLKDRCKLISDFAKFGGYFFRSDFDYDPSGVKKHFAVDGTAENLRKLESSFSEIDDKNWSHDTTMQALTALATELGIKPAQLIHPTRLATSGATVGPGLYELLAALGKDRVQNRLERAINYIEKGQFPFAGE